MTVNMTKEIISGLETKKSHKRGGQDRARQYCRQGKQKAPNGQLTSTERERWLMHPTNRCSTAGASWDDKSSTSLRISGLHLHRMVTASSPPTPATLLTSSAVLSLTPRFSDDSDLDPLRGPASARMAAQVSAILGNDALHRSTTNVLVRLHQQRYALLLLLSAACDPPQTLCLTWKWQFRVCELQSGTSPRPPTRQRPYSHSASQRARPG